MIKVLDNLGSFLIGLLLTAMFLGLTVTSASKAVNMEAYGFGQLEDKSQRASGAKLLDAEEYKHFSELQYIMLAAIDNGFTNNQTPDSYYQYQRKIFIDKGGVSPVQFWCQYDIRNATLDKVGTVLGVASTAAVTPVDSASSMRIYDLYINRRGDTFFKRR